MKNVISKNMFCIMGPFDGRVLYKRSRENKKLRKFYIP